MTKKMLIVMLSKQCSINRMKMKSTNKKSTIKNILFPFEILQDSNLSHEDSALVFLCIRLAL